MNNKITLKTTSTNFENKGKLTNKIIDLSTLTSIFAYSCGPTVYGNIHIGNLRSIIFPKIFLNYLNIVHNIPIIHIQNFTDIDKKILNKAFKKKTTIKKITIYYKNECIKIMKKFHIYNILNIKSYYPSTLNYLEPIKQLINLLLLKKQAYENSSGIYLKLKNIEYCLTQRQKKNNLISQKNKFLKINKEDFCLWKFLQSNIIKNFQYQLSQDNNKWLFKNKIGIPGWHIECVIMCNQFIKKNKILNFYFGGQDLIFPHHENANILFKLLSKTIIVQNWIHNGLITINNIKMSKSKNNTILVKNLLKKYHCNSIKLFILSNSYFKTLSFNQLQIENYEKLLNKIKKFFNNNKNVLNINNIKIYNNIYSKKIFSFLDKNFNIQGALGYIQKIFNNKNYNLKHLIFIIDFFFNKILLMQF